MAKIQNKECHFCGKSAPDRREPHPAYPANHTPGPRDEAPEASDGWAELRWPMVVGQESVYDYCSREHLVRDLDVSSNRPNDVRHPRPLSRDPA